MTIMDSFNIWRLLGNGAFVAVFVSVIVFLIFRAKGLPSAAKRLIHILIIFVSVILILFSLTHGSSLSMQELVLGYFAFSILYLLIYGVCMLVRFLIRRKKNGQS